MLNREFIRQTGHIRWASRLALYQFQKRILKQDITMRLPTGSSILLPRDHSQSSIFISDANVDWGAEELFSKFADEKRDFLDIGANIGYYSNYLSPLVRRVYAFEPDPRNLPHLRRNAALGGNILVVDKAVSSRNGGAGLSLGGGSTTNTLEEVAGAEKIDVSVTTVDAFVEENPGIDVGMIKTDIEGHDLHALRGMESTVERFQPLILSEIIIDSELISLVKKWRYRLFAFTCDRVTFAIKLQQLAHEEEKAPSTDWYKMVFLTPPCIDLLGI
jgi:FkbM family methyltransferase